MGMFNDLLNILPGLFVIGGIFGTFLGVMSALPELSHMDIANPEITKKVLDAFLLKLAYSMSTSIMGIMFSVGMTILNATMSPDGTYLSMVNKFTSSLEFLWNDTDTNELAQVESPAAADRRAVLFTNLSAKAARNVETSPVPAQAASSAVFADPVSAPYVAPVVSAPARAAAPRVQAVPAPVAAAPAPTPRPAPAPAPVAAAPTPVVAPAIPVAAAPARAAVAPAPVEPVPVTPEILARVQALEARSQTLERYMTRSYEDKINGVIAEELWSESNKHWLAEKQQILQELKAIKRGQSSPKAA